ncbi:AraC family multidrug resistance transcriptional activator [Erwinia persicina]|jgi:AraC family multidrug resistance transcriptional activator|uniref:helix-turn-helix domain-containing protein n=1 Tax=Erwinia TaxID=551 RepID=UPI00209E8A03|nr:MULTISPECIES: helix-turn-helix domain-containing protein [Erwinia]MCP1437804.1 AraC family multidrug resistance transcriptional activator [Erwinia persicina]MDN4628094.1 helix-turn-helix domain-containing protein [Erwinia sp. PsM31]MDN8541164.1 helix-turn-helix domain-containing protein [Erwinia sp. BC051422]
MQREQIIIYELAAWIDANIHRPLKIDDVAEKAGYSKWHLQRMFQRVMGKNLGNYIRDTKLALAAGDLIKTTETVMTISQKYGYESQQTFTRIFAKKYHKPPAAFRKYNALKNGPDCCRTNR